MTVDELVVELKLDGSQFTKGQKDAVDSFKKTSDEFDKRLKGTGEAAKNVGYTLGGLGTAAIGLASTLAGVGIVSWARDTMNSAAATGRMATNVGVATKELSAFGKMIERNGGSAEEANASLKGLADTIQNAKWGKGSAEFLTGLTQVGAGLNDSPIQIAEKLARFADDHNAQQVNQTGARLGLSQSVIDQALHGSARFLREYKEAFDVALNDDQVAKLQATQREVVKLEQSLRSLATTVEGKVAPGATTDISKLTGFIEDPLNAVRADAEQAKKAAADQGKFDPVASVLSWALGAPKGKAADAPAVSGPGDIDRYAAAIAAIESRGSGGYSAIGPTTSSGDRALGKYQVMASNVGPWSKAALGREISASEFLASPESQDAVFKHQFSKYIEKYGNPQDAASAWFTGRPQSTGANARDSLGTSGADYVRRFNSSLAQQGGGGGPVTIESITIHTQATDAKGIARDLGSAMNDRVNAKRIATNANTALQ